MGCVEQAANFAGLLAWRCAGSLRSAALRAFPATARQSDAAILAALGDGATSARVAAVRAVANF